MKIVRKIEISAPVEEVWKVLGNDFVAVHKWMAGVSDSIEIKNGQQVQNAPVVGRMAEIAINPGTFMDEKIIAYDAKSRSLTMNTTLVDVKGPLNGYDTEIKVRSLGDEKSEVIWTSKTSFGLLGYPLYFVIKKGLSDGFFRGLEELKHFVETGEPHERKLAAPHCG
ncbi:MAG: SRPBCC family protein [Aureispira sp.]